MDTNTLFITAARKKFRFTSAIGLLTVEQLFDLPLKLNRNGNADLDSVARAANAELKAEAEESFVNVTPNPKRAEAEESFVNVTPNPKRAEAEAKLEIVKAIIAIKSDEAEAARNAADRAAQKRKILDAISAKKDQALTSASIEDLEKQLEALG